MSKIIGAIVAVIVFVVWTMTFFVDEREKAIRFAFGEIKETGYTPGIHFKLPFPFNDIKKLDGRILTIDAKPVRFLTKEKKYVVVDSFVKWRITDESVYYKATSGGQEMNARSLVHKMVDDGLRNEFARRTVQEVIAEDRKEIMATLTKDIDEKARTLGIEVVDVRVKRIDLSQKVSQNVYARMRTERERLAREHRSKGKETATRIHADADAESRVIVAEAYREAQSVRGDGDAIAAATYAKAYGKSPEFYRFYRSMDAYKNTFMSKEDVMLINPDSEFFRYFNNSSGKRK
jgi:modulator of FtsH protease HflC